MPRITPVSPADAGLITRLLYRFSAKKFGVVPEPAAITAHHPRLLRAYAVHELMTQRASTVLPASVRELAVYRVAATIGCSWCIDFGAMLQRLDGLDVERLQQIDEFATSPLFSDDERAAIRYADAMTATPMTVDDAMVADLVRRFGEAGVVELGYQIGLENARARGNAALGITDQGFSTDSCRVPWLTEPERQAVTPA